VNLDSVALTTVFAALAVLLVLIIVRTLRKWNASENSFDIVDMFIENGRASKGAVVLMGAFVATTWFFVYYSLLGKMTEGYFGLYAAAWIAPVVARMTTPVIKPEAKEPL
jgi:hypothetical protein